MKKYTQLIIVLGGFFIAVLIRGFFGSNKTPVVVSKNNNQSSPPAVVSSTYKNGTYTGDSVDAYYGLIQVRVTVSKNKIAAISFLKYPNDNSTSQMVNEQAMPLLTSEAIRSQSAHVDIVTGASQTSTAFSQSLASALQQAK